MNDKDIDDLLNHLPKEMQPDRDLWTGIEYAIEMHDNTSATPAWKYASGVAVLVVAVAATWMFATHEHEHDVGFEGVRLTTLIEDMDESFVMEKAALLKSFEGEQSLTENWNEQLRELEEARLGVKQVLENNPNNVYMIQVMQNIQQQQLDLIKRVHTQVSQGI